MFEKVGSWVKAHPYATGALVLGGGLVFVMFSGWFSGGGSTTVASSGPSAAQLQSDTQLALGQIAAQVQTQQSNNNVAIANLAAQVQGSQYAAQETAALAQIQAAQVVSTQNTAASQAVSLANIQAQTDQANIVAQNNVALAQIGAGTTSSYIDAVKSIISDVINANKPAPAPTPVVAAPSNFNSDGSLSPLGIQTIEQQRPDVVNWFSAHKEGTANKSLDQWVQAWYSKYRVDSHDPFTLH